MAKLDRDGVALHYDVRGEGPLLLLSHGFSATSQMWRSQVDALADRYRFAVWDLRGHGRSGSPVGAEHYGSELCLEDIAALLDHCATPRAVIGGHSLGGYLSLAFYGRYPERVRALVLVGTGPGFKRDPGREAWNRSCRKQAEALEAQGLDALDSGQEAWAGSHDSAAGLARAARTMLVQRDAQVFELLTEVAVPTLVLVGSEDRAFRAAAEVMAARIPGAQLVVVEGAGHAPNVDRPEVVNAALREFLASLPAP